MTTVEENPLMRLLPPVEALAALDAREAGEAMVQITTTFTELLETAHRQDHDDMPDGGPHMRMRKMAEAQEMALMQAYGAQPQVLARIITSVAIEVALYDGHGDEQGQEETHG